ncbi:hypothetical protein DBY21_02930 [Candidatus Gastranaerophilales bacterium]|nr:MAG: hypothetical protein DBY21_02930 [Candidatus Gastranaerophilales bacterium]
MKEVAAKKVILKNKDDIYLLPYTSADADAVHKAGEETITGTKTFKNGVPIILQHPDATVAAPPGTVSNIVQDFRDASGARTGCVYNSITQNGEVLSQLQVIRGGVYNTLGLGIDAANKSTLTHNGVLLRYVDYFFANEWGWCRKWSDGWLEQGGIIGDFVGGLDAIVLSFLRPFLHTGYSIFVTRGGFKGDNTRTDIGIIAMSTVNCTLGVWAGSAGSMGRWYACGWDSTAQ